MIQIQSCQKPVHWTVAILPTIIPTKISEVTTPATSRSRSRCSRFGTRLRRRPWSPYSSAARGRMWPCDGTHWIWSMPGGEEGWKAMKNHGQETKNVKDLNWPRDVSRCLRFCSCLRALTSAAGLYPMCGCKGRCFVGVIGFLSCMGMDSDQQ